MGAPRSRRRNADGGPTIAIPDPDVPRAAAKYYGFRVDTYGTILSRSIMLADLRVLLAVCPASAGKSAYRSAVVEENVLGKPTASACRIAFHRLREFYLLDPEFLIFRALRDLWDADRAAQPLLALLCATGRDPILRAITRFLLALPDGDTVTPALISAEAERQFPSKFSRSVLAALGRNIASSWQQAGLLLGRRPKTRSQAESRPTAVAYALLLGDLCGRRGQALFDTLWVQLLDAPTHVLREQAAAASRQGWIEYRAAGDVVEVSFRHLVRDEAGYRV